MISLTTTRNSNQLLLGSRLPSSKYIFEIFVHLTNSVFQDQRGVRNTLNKIFYFSTVHICSSLHVFVQSESRDSSGMYEASKPTNKEESPQPTGNKSNHKDCFHYKKIWFVMKCFRNTAGDFCTNSKKHCLQLFNQLLINKIPSDVWVVRLRSPHE